MIINAEGEEEEVEDEFKEEEVTEEGVTNAQGDTDPPAHTEENKAHSS